MGLNFFALSVWHERAGSKGIFNTQQESARAKCLPHKMTHWLSPSEFPDCIYNIYIYIIQMISQCFSF